MLVLSIRPDSSVLLHVDGVCLAVTLVEIRGDSVRLGFDAPGEVVIAREEIARHFPPLADYAANRAAQKEAA